MSKASILYAQDEVVKIKKTETDASLDGNTISVKLTQEDTLLLESMKAVEIQIRILTPGGDALSSDIIRILVDRCLESEVLA